MTFRELKEALERVPQNQLNQQVIIKHKYGGEWDALDGLTRTPCSMYDGPDGLCDGYYYDDYKEGQYEWYYYDDYKGGELNVLLEKGAFYLTKI